MKRFLSLFLCVMILFSYVSAEEQTPPAPAGAQTAEEALPEETAALQAEPNDERGTDGEVLDQNTLLTYYDGALFIGDSIMQGLRRYRSARNETEPDFLRNIEIVCAGSIGLYQASLNRLSAENNLRYKNREMTLYQIVERLQPPKLFIMLGLNDPVAIKIDKAMTWASRIIRTVRERSPETQVYFFSNTPVTPRYCAKRKRSDYPQLVDEYNARLEALCAEQGAVYLDIATPLKDEEGFLRDDYSSDKYVHLSDEGVEVWIENLCIYAFAQYHSGLWTPAPAAAEETAGAPQGAEDAGEAAEAAATEGDL